MNYAAGQRVQVKRGFSPLCSNCIGREHDYVIGSGEIGTVVERTWRNGEMRGLWIVFERGREIVISSDGTTSKDYALKILAKSA